MDYYKELKQLNNFIDKVFIVIKDDDSSLNLDRLVYDLCKNYCVGENTIRKRIAAAASFHGFVIEKGVILNKKRKKSEVLDDEAPEEQ